MHWWSLAINNSGIKSYKLEMITLIIINDRIKLIMIITFASGCFWYRLSTWALRSISSWKHNFASPDVKHFGSSWHVYEESIRCGGIILLESLEKLYAFYFSLYSFCTQFMVGSIIRQHARSERLANITSKQDLQNYGGPQRYQEMFSPTFLKSFVSAR